MACTKIILTVFLILSVGCGNNEKMVELKFFQLYPDAIIKSRTIQDGEKEFLASVLVYYGVDFCYKEGKIYVNEKDTLDREYISNLCRKSKDSVWRKEHLK